MTTAWNAELYEDRHSFVWKYGAEVLSMLDPKPGERILDVGCGTGQLTAQLMEAGAEVVGLDQSAEMLERASANCPGARFLLGNAAAFQVDAQFDAVFSNAALHWVHDARGAAQSIAAVLKSGGRFVAEFGGKGNIRRLLDAVERAQSRRGRPTGNPWYFPSIAQYCEVLESARLEPVEAFLIDRLTPLEGGDGLRQWRHMFGEKLMADIPAEDREGFLHDLEQAARDGLYQDGRWWIDYRRLRVKALNRV